ncbi:MAG: TIGR03790 family protein [Pontiellaceae bacterium]|nr:TIGR03790 family protein [Pontiellaceae bacterium]MBN2785412.1 TIGR03790 family protein [Pontiellaceae bacterium]
MVKYICFVFAFMFSVSAWSQQSHEVLLLANKQSLDSLKVANAYAVARQIPPQNLVYLDIPEEVYGGRATMTPEQFTQLIWEPASAAAAQRGIDDHILAWVYSVDFPIRVQTDSYDRKQMSVIGLTFMRNRIPGLSLVEEGKYLSKLFAGPNERVKLELSALSFNKYRDGLGEDRDVPAEMSYLRNGLGDEMPLPSMMLGYTGENGNDLQEVLDTINRGVRSDFHGAHTGLYYLMSDDVRSTCREWQFYPAANELKQRGISANVTTNFPAGKERLMGLMMGAESVDTSLIGSFAPGAMAEHLTSWGAEFQKPQTKITDWIKAGATATAGTVVEPYSNPNKFPSARFFVHYIGGCSVMESFYQSIACPLQVLLLGDPLARPYAPMIVVRLLGADKIKDDFTFAAMANSKLANVEYMYTFLMDGKIIHAASSDSTVWVPIFSLSDGYHELRVFVSPKHDVEFGASATKGIMVDTMDRSIEIDPASIKKTGKYTHELGVRIGGIQTPRSVRLIKGGEILDEQDYSNELLLTLDEQLLGEGRSAVQVVGVYSDGMKVASEPLALTVTFAQ